MTNWYDITISRDAMEKQGMTEQGIQTWMMTNAFAKRWAYGRETGDQGYEHLQCRICTRLTFEQMKAVFQKLGHVSMTHAKDFDYVLKDGNAVLGWKMSLQKYANIQLYPWQERVKQALAMQDDRTITVVLDRRGGTGKSFLARHLEAQNLAKIIPKMSRAEDMISACMVNPSDAYVFDIPRSDDKRAVGLWIAIEQIKNGHLYDWRYQYRETWIDPPRILLFTNTAVDMNALSKDRWDIIDLEEMEGAMGINAPMLDATGQTFSPS